MLWRWHGLNLRVIAYALIACCVVVALLIAGEEIGLGGLVE